MYNVFTFALFHLTIILHFIIKLKLHLMILSLLYGPVMSTFIVRSSYICTVSDKDNTSLYDTFQMYLKYDIAYIFITS